MTWLICHDSFIRGVRVGESRIKLIVGWLMTGGEGKTVSMDYYLGELGYEAERLVTTSGPGVDRKLSIFCLFFLKFYFLFWFFCGRYQLREGANGKGKVELVRHGMTNRTTLLWRWDERWNRGLSLNLKAHTYLCNWRGKVRANIVIN